MSPSLGKPTPETDKGVANEFFVASSMSGSRWRIMLGTHTSEMGATSSALDNCNLLGFGR